MLTSLKEMSKTIAFRIFIIFSITTSLIVLITGAVNQKVMVELFQEQQMSRINEVSEKSLSSVSILSLYIRQSLSTLQKSIAISSSNPKQLQSLLEAATNGNGNLISSAYFIHSDGQVDGWPYGYWEEAAEPMILNLIKESRDKGSAMWWTDPYVSKLSGRTITFAMVVPSLHNQDLLIGDNKLEDNYGIIAVDLNLYEVENRIAQNVQANAVDVALFTSNYIPIAVKSSSVWDMDRGEAFDQNTELKHFWESSKQLFQKIRNGQSEFVTMKRQVPLLNWQMVLTVDYNQYSSLTSKLKHLNILIFISAMMLMIIFAVFISTYFSAPLKQIIWVMRNTSEPMKSPLSIKNRYDEIGQLIHSFHSMLYRIDSTAKALLQGEKDKKNLEIKALQSQINPHFLQNTLTSILWSVKLKKLSESENMIIALSDLLLFSMDKIESVVTVRDEMRLAKSYIELQQIRYPSVFEWSIDVTEEASLGKIPKLTLQPLVENAIYHGLMGIGRNGRLRICSYLEGNDILIEVADNGVGITDAEQSRLVDKQYHHQGSKGLNKIGVRNVNERLRLEFGESYGLIINSSPLNGTIVTIKIPGEERSVAYGADGHDENSSCG